MTKKNTLIKIPMLNVWQLITDEVCKKTGKDYPNWGYVRDVFYGAKSNKGINKVLDSCINKVRAALLRKGMCPARPLSARQEFTIHMDPRHESQTNTR